MFFPGSCLFCLPCLWAWGTEELSLSGGASVWWKCPSCRELMAWCPLPAGCVGGYSDSPPGFGTTVSGCCIYGLVAVLQHGKIVMLKKMIALKWLTRPKSTDFSPASLSFCLSDLHCFPFFASFYLSGNLVTIYNMAKVWSYLQEYYREYFKRGLVPNFMQLLDIWHVVEMLSHCLEQCLSTW